MGTSIGKHPGARIQGTSVVGERLPWARLVELAGHFEAVRIARDEIDPALATRLSRAVLDFQEQLLGGTVKSGPATSAGGKLAPAPTTGPVSTAASRSADQDTPPWERAVELAQHFEALRVTRGEIDPTTATNLARAVLALEELLRDGAAKASDGDPA